MKYNFILFLVLFCMISFGQRRVTLLDDNWKFLNRDGEYQLLDVDDKDWQRVRVPHDWAIAKEFNMSIDTQTVMVREDNERVAKLRTGRTGSLPFLGVGWYRHDFDFSKADPLKKYFLEFDGVMNNCRLFINGKFVHFQPWGYTSFSVDITPYITFSKGNVLAVRAENKPLSARWYAGGGIYRNVRLVEVSPIFIPHWGTNLTTKDDGRDAVIDIRTKLENILNAPGATLITSIVDNKGNVVAKASNVVDPSSKSEINQQFNVSNVLLWSIERPNLYKAISEIYYKGKRIDDYSTDFGVRTLAFDPIKGFSINGLPTKFKGVCMHHDLGPLGAAVNYRALERQVEILKEMGCNAIRTSHNMPAPELLEICNRLGMFVMDECFDEWKVNKNENGYGQYFDDYAEQDLTAMIHRDRNNPSVVMWSIGNEVREQDVPGGGMVAKFLYDIVKREDATRPVTAGLNNHQRAVNNGFAPALDILGLNYKPNSYKEFHQRFPNHVILGTETASTVSSRGVYHFPVVERKSFVTSDTQCSSYDLDATGWSQIPDEEFVAQHDNSFVMGEFVWTGFDYLGEPTPYGNNDKARSSYFGILDLAGMKKDRFYLYQSEWSSKPVLHILPHWNWEGRIGQITPVHCYTNYPQVELFLNGKSLGVRKKGVELNDRFRMTWDDVVYQPGELKAIAYDQSGKAMVERVVKTAGSPDRIVAIADRSEISADKKDICFVEVSVVDKDGNPCPASDALMRFKVSGKGKYVAACNGDPTSQTSFSSDKMNLFSGKCMAIIGYATSAGKISLRIDSPGLKSGYVEIRSR